MKWIITAAGIFYFTIALSQNKITDTAAITLIKEIAVHNIYESEILGDGDSESVQYVRFERLKKRLIPEQFFHLALTHKNGVVRAYAYLFCIANKDQLPHFDKLISKLKKDKTKIKTVSGCLGRIKPVNQLFGYAD